MKNTLTRKMNTVSASYLPYAAYQSALALATAHKGKIGKTDKGNFKATFSSAKVAEKFVAEWTAEYNANRKVEVAPTPKSTPTQKPKASKGKTDTVTVTIDGVEYTVPASVLVLAQKSSTSKSTAKKSSKPSPAKNTTPKRTKAKGFDFATIKGKTISDKNRALHSVLVSMGMKDSRSADYQAIWNARPWAK